MIEIVAHINTIVEFDQRLNEWIESEPLVSSMSCGFGTLIKLNVHKLMREDGSVVSTNEVRDMIARGMRKKIPMHLVEHATIFGQDWRK